MTVLVLAPSPTLTVTIESDEEIHLHAGGQGVWVARLLGELRVPVGVCCSLGGESGTVLSAMLGAEQVDATVTPVSASNGVYVHDRRDGQRRELSAMPAARWTRHDLDEWYGSALTRAMDATIVILTGTEPAEVVPAETYRRLARDLRHAECRVFADLSGDALHAAVEGGLDLVKASASELSGEEADLPRRLDELRQHVPTIIATRADEPTIAVEGDRTYLVTSPVIEPYDERGAGDSFMAGLAAGLHEGRSLPDSLRLAAAAGTLNATRRGLGTGRLEDVERMAEHVVVTDAEANGEL